MRRTESDDAADVLPDPLVASDSAERSREPAAGRVANQHDARVGRGFGALLTSRHGTFHSGLGFGDVPGEGRTLWLCIARDEAQVRQAARHIEPVRALDRNHGDSGDAAPLQGGNKTNLLWQPVRRHVVDLVVAKPGQYDKRWHITTQHHFWSGRRFALETASPEFRYLRLAVLLDSRSQRLQLLHACTKASGRSQRLLCCHCLALLRGYRCCANDNEAAPARREYAHGHRAVAQQAHQKP